MTARARGVRWSWLAGLACLIAAGGAGAATNPATCVNDKDCIATPQCGGDVCDYTHVPNFTCKPAGGDPQGSDGWCTVDTDCKCYAQGARCVGAIYCTFTIAPDAGSSGGTTGSAGTTGAGGSTGTAGTTGTSGGGGCNVAGSTPLAWPLALGAVGLCALSLRRRARRRS